MKLDKIIPGMVMPFLLAAGTLAQISKNPQVDFKETRLTNGLRVI